MNQLVISANKIFDGHTIHLQAQLVIQHGKIVRIEAINGAATEHIDGLLCPGFIDLQVNGGGGALFNSHCNETGITTMLNAHRRFGSTAMLPTLITDDIAVMRQAADTIALVISQQKGSVLGIHFEGPHLSVTKKGAHSEKYIRPLCEQEWTILSRKDLGQIAVTIAPENVSIKDIKRMVSLGVKVFLGHSNASFTTVQLALDAGACGFTHLFNAMSPLTSRAPGMVGAALLNDDAVCGLIVDGQHVDYATCKIALKTKPPGSVILVTDAMPVVGTDNDRFNFFDREVVLTENRLNSTTGELAGSTLNMAQAVRNTIEYLSVSIEEALRMASYYPAVLLNQQHNYGQFISGARGDIVALNQQLHVTQTWVAGK